MNRSIRILASLLVFSLTTFLSAQMTVSGTVTDATTGAALSGANVVVDGTDNGAAANACGCFTRAWTPWPSRMPGWRCPSFARESQRGAQKGEDPTLRRRGAPAGTSLTGARAPAGARRLGRAAIGAPEMPTGKTLTGRRAPAGASRIGSTAGVTGYSYGLKHNPQRIRNSTGWRCR